MGEIDNFMPGVTPFLFTQFDEKSISFRGRVALRQKADFLLCHRYGVQLILDDFPKEEKEYTPAVLMIVFFGVLSGAQNMGLTSPHLEAFAIAKGSAAAIFNVIDRVPLIDSLSKEGRRLDSVNGELEFRNVAFRYPARKDVQVLQGLNLKINRGETVALVGESGCGKSTCVQLVQRFYDPLGGQVGSDSLIRFFLPVRKKDSPSRQLFILHRARCLQRRAKNALI